MGAPGNIKNSCFLPTSIDTAIICIAYHIANMYVGVYVEKVFVSARIVCSFSPLVHTRFCMMWSPQETGVEVVFLGVGRRESGSMHKWRPSIISEHWSYLLYQYNNTDCLHIIVLLLVGRTFLCQHFFLCRMTKNTIIIYSLCIAINKKIVRSIQVHSIYTLWFVLMWHVQFVSCSNPPTLLSSDIALERIRHPSSTPRNTACSPRAAGLVTEPTIHLNAFFFLPPVS